MQWPIGRDQRAYSTARMLQKPQSMMSRFNVCTAVRPTVSEF